MAEKQFVKGLSAKRHSKAPEWLVCSLGIKVDEFKNWLVKEQEGEYINVDIKIAKSGTMYAGKILIIEETRLQKSKKMGSKKISQD